MRENESKVRVREKVSEKEREREGMGKWSSPSNCIFTHHRKTRFVWG